MDPSSGRDGKSNSNSNSSPSEPENPFIRFKNFADAQVSSLLQGVIGLPSAFSKRSPEDNRWADIDEDLRRRDQLQARQQMLREQMREAEGIKADGNSAKAERQQMLREQFKEVEAVKVDGDSAKAEAEILIKKSTQRQVTPTSDQLRSYWGSSSDGESTAGFESQNDPNLNADLPLYSPITRELFANLRRPYSLSNLARVEWLPEPRLLDHLENGYSPSASLRTTRHMAFGFLRSSPVFRSEYSLLPYLLFSPYSPLKLDAEAAFLEEDDNLMYCAAFEDLIRTTQGKKNTAYPKRPGWSPRPAIGTGLSGHQNWNWITDLYVQGMLQQKHPVSLPLPASRIWRDLDVQEGGPHTELDWFEQILTIMSNDSTEPDSIQSILGALYSRDERRIREGLGLTSLHDMIAQARERARTEAQQSQTTSPPQEQNLHDLDRGTAKSALSTDRIVSTSATTERTTHEDGTVETCVTIWKRFDDGRETTTTTTHTEDPGWDDKEQHSWPVEAAPKKTGEKEIEQNGEKKDQKKGWFWN